jgi:hypothetical protein
MMESIDGKPLTAAWIKDCLTWRGKVLTGRFRHWCDDWDGLPIDETSLEWPCACAPHLRYRDTDCPERACDHCGTPYRGPAVYCSLACVLADA